jgi:phosphate transport system permease protein
MHLAFLVALIPLAWVLWTVVSRGLPTILEATWWTNSQKGIATRDEGGGAYHAIVGSVIQVGVASISPCRSA